jgi:hypothetical protein
MEEMSELYKEKGNKLYLEDMERRRGRDICNVVFVVAGVILCTKYALQSVAAADTAFQVCTFSILHIVECQPINNDVYQLTVPTFNIDNIGQRQT